MRGLLVATFPKLGLLSSEVYDPIWAAAQDLGLPIHLHLAVGDARGKVFTEQRNVRGLMPGQILINSMGNMEALARLLFGGIGELSPKLKIVSVEGNIGWIPYFLERADRIYSAIATGHGWSCRCHPASISAARSTRPLFRIAPDPAARPDWRRQHRCGRPIIPTPIPPGPIR